MAFPEPAPVAQADLDVATSGRLGAAGDASPSSPSVAEEWVFAAEEPVEAETASARAAVLAWQLSGSTQPETESENESDRNDRCHGNPLEADAVALASAIVFRFAGDCHQKSRCLKVSAGICCLLLLGWCMFDFARIVDDREVLAAQRFRDEPKDNLFVTVLEAGVEYIGTCSQNRGACPSAGMPADNEGRSACDALSTSDIPSLVDIPESGTTGHLRSGRVCEDTFVPWLLLRWPEDGANFTRCAYEFGTRAASARAGADFELTKVRMAREYPKGSKAEVWARRLSNRCVVGYGSLDDLLQRVRNRVPWSGVFVKLMLVAFCVVPFFFDKLCSIWLMNEPLRSMHQRLATDPSDTDLFSQKPGSRPSQSGFVPLVLPKSL